MNDKETFYLFVCSCSVKHFLYRYSKVSTLTIVYLAMSPMFCLLYTEKPRDRAGTKHWCYYMNLVTSIYFHQQAKLADVQVSKKDLEERVEALRTVKETAEQPEKEAKERHLKAWEGKSRC